ncbi:ScbR family autoregulator-binding transcription factor [Streptomyces sp. TLI_171]|uniref:ScbR family autoregulator-binding transcription factor n=1 Tax=Streptomyces sp. TLI_171 TaxID=1938859 RepID=UPI000C185A65|nr:ScbR family autoregulator-binding transcription factor [Streptomyces sp. TLI_171]RKE20667.1 TetR family transcriptional regulator [Streptomyces sp. TLI_171]
MTKQERGIRSRRAILEAAAEVFDLRGYDAAGTNEILARTGLTRGALYHHFASKEAIALAVLEAHNDGLAVPESTSRLQAVIDLGFAFADRLRTDAVLRASVRLAVEQTSLPRPTDTPYDQSRAVVRTLLTEAAAHGETLPGLDVTETSDVIIGSFTGVRVMSQVYTDRADLPERLTALWRVLLPGIASPGMIGHLRITPPQPAGLD